MLELYKSIILEAQKKLQKEKTLSDSSYKPSLVKLEHYSGPLDLLLQLIRKQEMDIFQIDIYTITHQYVEYLKQVPAPDLEMAGDFIRMASVLLHIKSKSLLPKEEQEEDKLSASDLKNNLSQLLLAYQKFQKTGELLYSRILLGRDCWKSPRILSLKDPTKTKIEIDKEKGVFQLSQAYHKSLIDRKAKKNYKIYKPVPSFLHRLKQIAEFFTVGARLKFNQLTLIKQETHSRLLSFLSILELSKAGFVSLLQKQLFSNIEIFVKKAVTEESINEISREEEQTMSEKWDEKSLT